jgi:hypothetical protein
MNTHLLAYYIGIAIVFVSHIYIVATSGINSHAAINLLGASLIAYYFMHKEGFIKF